MEKYYDNFIENALFLFKQKKVMTMQDLVHLFECSQRTVQRRLKKWDYITSYNYNGRFYTLPDIAKFDKNGLWHYKNICFSKYGNLKQTLIHLVKNADEGLTSGQIGKLLGLNPRSFLSHFKNEANLNREKIAGKYMYFSTDFSIYKTQKDRHEKRIAREKTAKPLTDFVAILLLVECVKKPDYSLQYLVSCLKGQGVEITAKAISDFFLLHGIEKKTADSA